MKIKIAAILVFLVSGIQSYALDWHEDLISYMMSLPINDKQIVVERDEKKLTIKRASYIFSFARSDVEKTIKKLLYAHAKEAIKFSSERGIVILQVLEAPDIYYTYKIGNDPKNPVRYVLMISVNQGRPQDFGITRK